MCYYVFYYLCRNNDQKETTSCCRNNDQPETTGCCRNNDQQRERNESCHNAIYHQNDRPILGPTQGPPVVESCTICIELLELGVKKFDDEWATPKIETWGQKAKTVGMT